ncbi:MAG: hypothetical protein AMJ93_08640 [Anaerolineae bacterium SM23_84]|nr:MAG: hypothetical protein AMJ93_08640 [Anaerolineae bacterium SM23_84]
MLWWARQDYVLVRWVELWEEKGLSAFLTRWAELLRPLQDVLSVALDLTESVANKLDDWRLNLLALFNRVSDIAFFVNAWVKSGAGRMLDNLLTAWGVEGGVGERLDRWAVMMGKVQNVLQPAITISQAVSTKLEDWQLALLTLFSLQSRERHRFLRERLGQERRRSNAGQSAHGMGRRGRDWQHPGALGCSDAKTRRHFGCSNLPGPSC